MTIKKMLTSSNLPQNIYEQKFHDWLKEWSKKKDAGRGGHFHASSLIDKNFCLMKAVLEERLPAKQRDGFPPKTLSTFKVGIYVHDKHQEFYKETGMAESIEQQYYSELLDMTATPDAILKFMRTRTIAEIKSMNGFEFGKLTAPPKNAYAQAQIYMYVTATPQALIIVEDKNFQDLKVYLIEFNLTDALEYIRRRRVIMRCLKYNVIPVSKRLCQTKTDRKKCKYNEPCWNSDLTELGVLK